MKPNLFVLILLFSMACAPVAAQTTFASVTGTVTDPSGAVLPGARVEAVHAATKYRYETQANDAGVYTLPQLREGRYELTVSAPGMKQAVVKDLQLVSRAVRRVDIGMEVGTVETAIEVTADPTPIETETARISQVKDSGELKSLPMNTRSLWGFLATVPGVGEATTVSATRRFAGSRRNQSDASVDGISITASNGTQITPLVQYIESFQEVRVDMANNTAENGTVGLVNVVSKSGTNALHGSLFDYYVTPMFRARDPFQSQRPTGISHNPGVSAGGPIWLPRIYNGRNKTFFFASLETSRGSAVQQSLNPTVPLAAWRRGDFSAAGVTLRDPSTQQTIPGARIPETRLNTVAVKLQERFYPLPNAGDPNQLTASNYRELKVRGFDPNTYFTTRIDHRFRDESFIFGRFTWQRSQNLEYTGNLPTIGQQWRQRNTRAAALSYTRAIRADLLNEARWGLSFTNEPRWGPLRGKDIVREFGLTGYRNDLPDLPGVFNVGFSGIGLTGITQQVWSDPAFYNLTNFIQDHLSWFRGRHSIKAGFTITHANAGDATASNDLYGNMTFSNRFTGHPYADFLLGIPTTARRVGPPLEDMRTRWAYDLFVTDEFKAARNLTLSFGARYELHPAWRAVSGLAAVFDPRTGNAVVASGALGRVSTLVPQGYVNIVEAREAGLPGATLLYADKNNIAPRFSVAYRPWDNRTVVRAGFGVFYDLVPRSVSTNASPFAVNEPSYTNPTPNPVVILPQIFPVSVAGLTTIGLPGATKTDIRMPYSMQYNLTIEHERWGNGFRISYIGTNTRQGEYTYNINAPVPDSRPYVDKPRAFPKYPGINLATNGAGHQYHSLNLEVRRQFASGLLYDFSWVWARDIGDLERDQSQENPFDRRRERAVWEDIPTHRFAGDVIYELPLGRGKKWLAGGRLPNLLFGGWELSAAFGSHSGYFLTPAWTGPDPTGTAQTSSRTPPSVTIRPNHLRNANYPEDQRTVTRWYDWTAFGAPTPGFFGTSAKGVIKGPGSWNLNAGIAKQFLFSENARLRWELTSTNVANHPNWSLPGLNITSQAQRGVITGVGGGSGLDEAGPRRFRTALRLEW